MKLSRNKAKLDEDNVLDLETGEISEELKPEPDNMSDWSTRDKDQFQKCEYFTKEIESRKLDLLRTESDRVDIVTSLLKFGEEGYKLWERLSETPKNFTFTKEQVRGTWDKLDKEGKGDKTPSKFFAICK